MLALVLPSSFTEYVNPSSSIRASNTWKELFITTLLPIPKPCSTPTRLSTLTHLTWFPEHPLTESYWVCFGRATLNIPHQECNTIFQMSSDNSIRLKKPFTERLLCSRLIFFLILTTFLLMHPKNTLALFVLAHFRLPWQKWDQILLSKLLVYPSAAISIVTTVQ